MYRPLKAQIQHFIEYLEKLLNYVNSKNAKLILGGDLNIDILKSCRIEEALFSAVESSGYAIITDTATCATSHTQTLIDLFIKNIHTESLTSGVLNCDISDHLPIYLFIRGEDKLAYAQMNDVKTAQNIVPISLSAFYACLEKETWTDVYDSLTADAAYEGFISAFKRIYFEHFKEKILRKCNKSRKPWINRECLRRIKKKARLFVKFLKTRSPEDLDIYKKFCNKLNTCLKNEKLNISTELPVWLGKSLRLRD